MLDQDNLFEPYKRVRWYADAGGHIVWRTGTGGNEELLHIRAYEPGYGHGTFLLGKMLERLLDEPPYATVFGFTRTSNAEALEFYRRSGFVLSTVAGVYADGDAVVFSQTYAELCRLHGIERSR